MPQFIDYHATMPPFPPEVAQQMAEHIKSGQVNGFGAKPLNIYLGTNGSGYCLTEAPNAEAVLKSHAANGVLLGENDITEINTLV